MRKLAMAAVSFSGAVFLWHYLVPDAALIYCAFISAAIAGTAFLFKGDVRRRILLICLGLAAGFLWTFIYTAVWYAPALSLDGKTERVSAVVADFPVRTDYGEKLLVRVQPEGRPSVKTQLYVYGGAPDLKPGDTIAFTGRFRLADTIYGEKTDSYKSSGVFLLATLKDEITVTGEKTPFLYLPNLIRHAVTDKIGAIFPADTAGFMKALLMGDTSGMYSDKVLSGALSVTGTAHIVAVSGMNIAFLIGVFGLLIKKKRLLAAVCIPVVVLFMAVVGFMPPVTRAGIMQLFLLAAPLLKRETDAVTSLSASLLIILLVNPFSAGNIGLQLSFAATLGILLFTGRIYAALDEPLCKSRLYKHTPIKKTFRFILANIATTVGALSLSLPLIALHFGIVSIIAPLSNLAVLWAVTLAFIGGIAAVVLAFIFTPIGIAAAFIIALPARIVLNAIAALSHVSFASVYTSNPGVVIWLVYLYLMLAGYLAFRAELRRYILPACLSTITLCLILVLTSFLSDRRGMSVTALDVGQGQCIVITSGSFTEVVDCGSLGGKAAGDILTRYLQSHGRTSIDLLVLTHYHEDHAGGVEEVLSRNRVIALAAPDPSLDGGSLPAEITEAAATYSVQFVSVTRDISAAIGNVTVCLYAPIGRESVNERGLTVLCSENDFDTLITGDMSADIEKLLVAEKQLPDIEVLVAGHHGSKYATSDTLLRAVTPEAAVISVGYNSYGHPAPETLERLALYGITVYRTDTNGNITITAP